MNKRGDFTGVLYFIIAIFAMAAFLLIAAYISNEVGSEFKTKLYEKSVDDGLSPLDISGMNNTTTSTITLATTYMPVIYYILFGGLLISLLITAYLMPTHPIFAIVFIIGLAITVILAMFMSNAYEKLAINDDLNASAEQQSTIGYMMNNLPWFALVVGIIIMVITFAKPFSGGGGGNVPV